MFRGDRQKFRGNLLLIYGLGAVMALGLDYSALLPLGLVQLLWLAWGRPSPKYWLGLQIFLLLVIRGLWVKGSQLQALSPTQVLREMLPLQTRL